MNSKHRSRFLQTVRSALDVPPDRRRSAPAKLFPDRPSAHRRRLLQQVEGRSAADHKQLLQTLQAAAAPLNLKVLPAASADAARDRIVDIACSTAPEWGGGKQICAWRHPVIDRLGLAAAMKPHDIGVVTSDPPDPETDIEDQRRRFTAAVWDSFIGVTSADHLVADTATLVLRTRPGQPRSVSLVPSIHVAVVPADRMVADLPELYAVLRWQDNRAAADLTNCLTFISGPSKTADIEATLVHGAHGPRELVLIVLEA